MSAAEKAERERSVFEDDDEDDSDMSDDSDINDDGQTAAQPPPRPQPELALSSALSGGLSASTPSHDAAIPSCNSVPELNPVLSAPTAAHLQNGAIPIQVLPSAVPSSAAPPFFVPAHFPVSTASGSGERTSFAVVGLDDSRRLFQRLWTDEEEIRILQGFFEFTSRRGTTFASHQYDSGPFYDEIKKQLQFVFTKNQLIEKLRRLKKKYRNCVSRMQSWGKNFIFRSAHERAVYDISRKIWSAGTKRAHDSDEEDINTPNSNAVITVRINDGSMNSERRNSRSRRRMRRRMIEEAAAGIPDPTSAVGGVDVDHSTPPMQIPLAPEAVIPNIIEETVKSCLSPLFKELINHSIRKPLGPELSNGTSPLNFLPMNLGGGSLSDQGLPMDEKWTKQQILELEIYLKRLELVRDHIKSTLEELKSSKN